MNKEVIKKIIETAGGEFVNIGYDLIDNSPYVMFNEPFYHSSCILYIPEISFYAVVVKLTECRIKYWRSKYGK